MAKQSNARSNLVSRSIEGRKGWSRDPYDAGVIKDWYSRFPNLPIVADGRRCKVCRDKLDNGQSPLACKDCYSAAGRGTNGFDLFRVVNSRADFLSIKTETIGSKGELPSKLSLSTGNEGTLNALLEGIYAGNDLPTVVFAAKKPVTGP